MRKGVKSTSLGNISLIKWFFRSSGVSAEKARYLLKLVERKAMGMSVKMKKRSRKIPKAWPEIWHGHPVL